MSFGGFGGAANVSGGAFGRAGGSRAAAAPGGGLPFAGIPPELQHGVDRLLAEDAVKNKDRIIALSKAMYVVTPFTSLLVLENEEMYQQFKVDRGRKDHWAPYPAPERIDVVYEPEDGPPFDPRKGVKPSVEQVRKTVLVRLSPRVLVFGTESVVTDYER